ncbi:hypothetical protein [Lysinibacillus fusiformis]|uniref:hypothetical protein n=1 Tax=Lysinibacillus fusiformis TaxID=28031 RepID=UPI0035576185
MDIYYDTGTKIKVTFTDDQFLIGIVDHWTSSNDSEDDVQELTIKPTDGELKDQLVNFNENEVKKIEIIE